ncbi:MAG: hypothetical protein DRR08_22510 [Candidatus Parabeggiatoa sp. nov. 2]|nr:MAG: hypothetical protein B6247_26975 [Beggiatoa sp. 4572_84]RKZ56120.1 MAG: hypothetical protein DRR08_22510 [Gammaproteobacteria bacterium]
MFFNMGITRSHLSRLVKQGKTNVTKQPNGYSIYNASDVYGYVGKKRRNLNVIYARFSTSKQKADLVRQIETFNFYSTRHKNCKGFL